MNLWKVLDRFRSFFKGEEGVSTAPPIAEQVLKTECESQMVDEHDRSTKLEDLNLEDWPSEDSFKLVSDFLDSMPFNSQDTEPVPSTPNSCSETNCGIRILSANAVLEAETAPTPNKPSKSPIDNSNGFGLRLSLPWNKVPFINFEVAAGFVERIYCATFCQIWSAEYFWQTHQSSSGDCMVVQLKLDQLDMDVVDHRALLVSTQGKKCSYLFMTDVVVVVHHAQLRKPFYCHGHTDRRDIGVATRRITIQDRVQALIYRSAFWVLGNFFV